MAKAKWKRVPGDTFILCTFPLTMRGIPYVYDSDMVLSSLCSKIPEHAKDADEDGDVLSMCRVEYWVVNENGDPSDAIPRGIKTLFEVQPHELDAMEDDEDEGEEPAPKIEAAL